MKTNLKISLIAGLLLAAGLAYSQSPMAGGGCDMIGGGMHGEGMGQRSMGKMDPAKMQAKMQARMDQRHAALKAQLKLTPAQEPAWTAFVASHTLPAGMMGQPAAMADLAKLPTPERIDKMKEMRAQRMGEMSAAMEKRGEATKVFYAALTPEQQKVFDVHFMQGPGKGKHRGMGMMQPES